MRLASVAPAYCYVGQGWRSNTKTAYKSSPRGTGLTSLSGLIMQIRWFIVLLILALSACGENPGAQKGDQGPAGLEGPSGPPGPVGPPGTSASWTASVAKPAQLHAKRMSASSALTRLIREGPSLSRPITAKLPFDLSGRAFQSGSSSHASRSDHPFVYGDRLGPAERSVVADPEDFQYLEQWPL